MLPETRTNWPLWSFARAASTVPRISNPHATLIPSLCSDNVSCCTRFVARPDLNDHAVFQSFSSVLSRDQNWANESYQYLIRLLDFPTFPAPTLFSSQYIYARMPKVSDHMHVVCTSRNACKLGSKWHSPKDVGLDRSIDRSRFGFIVYKEAR